MTLSMLMMLTFVSCGTAGFYRDFKPYVSRENPPDVGSGQSEPMTPPVNTPNPVTQAGLLPETAGTESVADEAGEIVTLRTGIDLLTQDVIGPEASADRKQMPAVTDRAALAEMGKRLVTEQQGKALSARQEKRIEKVARKTERLLGRSGPDIDFRNNTPLELFFMIMSAAGLVLGIFGVGFGWFVFIVFGGIWLYYKLVVDKK